jgi:predicted ATPase
VARQQQAKSLEFRATMSPAQLWQQQGRQAEGHQVLAEVYNWFTEGFDTADLQEARALLEELGRSDTHQMTIAPRTKAPPTMWSVMKKFRR